MQSERHKCRANTVLCDRPHVCALSRTLAPSFNLAVPRPFARGSELEVVRVGDGVFNGSYQDMLWMIDTARTKCQTRLANAVKENGQAVSASTQSSSRQATTSSDLQSLHARLDPRQEQQASVKAALRPHLLQTTSMI